MEVFGFLVLLPANEFEYGRNWENEPAESREDGGFWYVSGWGRGR